MTDDEVKRLLEGVQQHFDATAAETKRHFDATAAEIKRHFDVSTEAVRHEVQLVAESVTLLTERLEREVNRLDEKMDRGFAETQAMIRFSHVELERRIRKLEQAFSDLQSRVERLEETTH